MEKINDADEDCFVTQVDDLRWKIEKRVLQRIGHVLRMENDRPTKAAVFGWLTDLEQHLSYFPCSRTIPHRSVKQGKVTVASRN